MRKPDVTSLVAGLALTAFGTLLLLDRLGELELGFGWTMPALTATVGIILLVSGLAAGRGER